MYPNVSSSIINCELYSERHNTTMFGSSKHKSLNESPCDMIFVCQSFAASSEMKDHLKLINIDQDSSGSDHWAKRRKLFKDSKQWSSAGGSSITSDITEESGTTQNI